MNTPASRCWSASSSPRLTRGGRSRVRRPGQALPIPAGTVHGFTAVAPAPALVLELSMPCDVADNVFESEPVRAWFETVVQPPRS